MTASFPVFSTSLVIDDDPVSRLALAEALRSCGLPLVLEAGNGREGLKQLLSCADIDLVFCDVFMPDMDGIEFINVLASQPAPPDLVLISGMDHHLLEMARDMAVAHGLSVRAALAKPVLLPTLQSLLRPAAP